METFIQISKAVGVGVIIALVCCLIILILNCLINLMFGKVGIKFQISRLFRIKHSIKELKNLNPKMPGIIADIQKRRDEGYIKSFELLDFAFTGTLNVDPERNWCYFPFNNKIVWFGAYGEKMQKFKLSEKLKFQLACVVYGLEKD